MTEITNTPDNGTGMSIEDAAQHIATMWDSVDDNETTDTVIDDDNNTSETTDEIVNDHPETESETTEEVEEDTSEETSSAITDDTKIKLDDGSELSIGEIKKGYLRQADYTKKTQELAAEKAQLGTMEQAKVEIRNQSLNEIGKIKHQLATHWKYDFDINWQQLAADDPYEYAQKKEQAATFESQVQQLAQLETALKQENERIEREAFVANQQRAREEIVQKFPEFGNKETATPILKGMTKYLSDNGFSKDEIEGIADSRVLSILYSAYKAQTTAQAVPAAKAAIADKPKISKPVNRPHGNTASVSAAKAFEASGSIEDAAAYIGSLSRR
ncbi:hypothetical protein [Agrobacterium tumefaciens]|uniref:Scaffolding protein n=1 Tax=Agrobacterium tumefaciens TaxID=358 RepID=A0AB36ECJ2_AGRTU|nr:hypothetical protein A6U91_18715 [Agrobacterium tumefaciens]